MKLKELNRLNFTNDLIGHTIMCPFQVPTVRPFQAAILINILRNEVLGLENVLKISGHKMNENALMAFKEEVDQIYLDIMTFRACVEN